MSFFYQGPMKLAWRVLDLMDEDAGTSATSCAREVRYDYDAVQLRLDE